MKKTLLILSTTALLASCGANNSDTGVVASGTHTPTTVTASRSLPALVADANITGPAAQTGSQVEIRYILRDTNENGEVLDENVSAGKQTLDTTLGQPGLIVGFERELHGMQQGQVKSFTVQPEDGYGTGTIVTEMDPAELAPEFTREVPTESLASIAKQTLPLKDMNPEATKMLEGKKAGDTVMEESGVKVVLVSKNDTEAVLEFHNLASPFYPKDITAGLEASMSGSTFKIEKVENNIATLHVATTSNPFTKDTYHVGSTGKYTIPGSAAGQAREIDIKILDITPSHVRVEVPNTHQLANKTLHFQVKVEKVMAPGAQTENPEIVTPTAQ